MDIATECLIHVQFSWLPPSYILESTCIFWRILINAQEETCALLTAPTAGQHMRAAAGPDLYAVDSARGSGLWWDVQRGCVYRTERGAAGFRAGQWPGNAVRTDSLQRLAQRFRLGTACPGASHS